MKKLFIVAALGLTLLALNSLPAPPAYELTFRFSTGAALVVEMDEDSHNGPESLILYGKKDESPAVCH